jgi:protein-S-isoprenylcysteine O-methyltransferase Ste14
MAARLVFGIAWLLLIAVAVVAHSSSFERPAKRHAGVVVDVLVVAPFFLVLGLFYLGRFFGVYDGDALGRLAGAVITVAGLVLYLLSHLYLRREWSLSASIREGHRLVTGGPYHLMRHPMYTGMTVIVLGSGLLVDNYLIIASTLVVGLVYYIRAGKEEALLSQEFPDFAKYVSKVKMFVPFVF